MPKPIHDPSSPRNRLSRPPAYQGSDHITDLIFKRKRGSIVGLVAVAVTACFDDDELVVVSQRGNVSAFIPVLDALCETVLRYHRQAVSST